MFTFKEFSAGLIKRTAFASVLPLLFALIFGLLISEISLAVLAPIFVATLLSFFLCALLIQYYAYRRFNVPQPIVDMPAGEIRRRLFQDANALRRRYDGLRTHASFSYLGVMITQILFWLGLPLFICRSSVGFLNMCLSGDNVFVGVAASFGVSLAGFAMGWLGIVALNSRLRKQALKGPSGNPTIRVEEGEGNDIEWRGPD